MAVSREEAAREAWELAHACPGCGCETDLMREDTGGPDDCRECREQARLDAVDDYDEGPGWHPADDRNFPPGWRH